MPTDDTEYLRAAVLDMVQNPWMRNATGRGKMIEKYNSQREFWIPKMTFAEREVFETLVPRW